MTIIIIIIIIIIISIISIIVIIISSSSITTAPTVFQNKKDSFGLYWSYQYLPLQTQWKLCGLLSTAIDCYKL